MSAWHEDASWAHRLRTGLGCSPRPVLVSCPLVGLNSQRRAAGELGMPWSSLHCFDIDANLEAALRLLEPNSKEIHLGVTEGNIMDVELETLTTPVDGLISGPPCPPHSNIGLKLRGKDERCSVFERVAQWILYFTKDSEFQWWILENVLGILKRGPSDSISWGHNFVQQMQDALGEAWVIRIQKLDSADSSLCQQRPRIFFSGIHKSLLQLSWNKTLLSAPLPRFDRPNLLTILDRHMEDGDFDDLTMNQKLNVMFQLHRFHKARSSMSPVPQIAIVDAQRTCSLTFDATPRYDCIPCLRTSRNLWWLLPCPELQSIFGDRGRALKPCELARASGLVYDSVAVLDDNTYRKALGNMFCVPQIGIVMQLILLAWVNAKRYERDLPHNCMYPIAARLSGGPG